MSGKKARNILFTIIALAFLLRIGGVNYGLPLWLISDEPPFTAAAFKMIEMKTLLPVLHEEVFKKIIYFPPYLAYVYLPFFVTILGTKYLFWHGTLEAFKQFIITDTSAFFLFARILNVLLGTATVWLTYLVSKNIFKKELAALLAAFFLATSLLHIDLSFVGRDWVPVIFLFALALYFLTKEALSLQKRFLLGALISSLAFGVSLMAGFIMVFMLFWYLFFERHSFLEALKEKTLWKTLVLFLILGGISIAIFPFGFVFAKYTSAAEIKTFAEYLHLLWYFFVPIFTSEPALISGAALGLIAAWKYLRNFFWTIVAFLFTFETLFYFTYHYHPRFTSFLFPLLAILAGFGVSIVYEKWRGPIGAGVLTLAFVVPSASAISLSNLAIKDDSRSAAREWGLQHSPENAKVIVEARLLRLPSTKEAIEEQKTIDAGSLRQIDLAEATFEKNPHGWRQFHALNLYTTDNGEFFRSIVSYAGKNRYEYLIFDPYMEGAHPEYIASLRDLAKTGTLLAAFGSPQSEYSIETGVFGNPSGLLSLERFGPRVEMYKLFTD